MKIRFERKALSAAINNADAIAKAIEEKIAVAKSRNSRKTKICCTRYGNVMCSRGSVIPLWIDQIRKGNPITLTEPQMTRFIMSLDEAVDLVLFAFEHGHNGDILVQKAPACTIKTQAEAVCELFASQSKYVHEGNWDEVVSRLKSPISSALAHSSFVNNVSYNFSPCRIPIILISFFNRDTTSSQLPS